MKKAPKNREHERPDVLPTEPLHYTIDAHLVNLLTWAHRSAGICAGMRFSHYGHKRMEVEANRRRITYMVIRAGRGGVKLEEVSRVLAGDLLPPRRRLAQDAIRRAAVLCEAARQFGRPSEPATPEMFATYLDGTSASPASTQREMSAEEWVFQNSSGPLVRRASCMKAAAALPV